MKLKDLTGLQFGRLTVVHRIGSHGKANRTFWLCRCVCGNEHEIASLSLTHGTKSCGCLRKEANQLFKEHSAGRDIGPLIDAYWERQGGRGQT